MAGDVASGTDRWFPRVDYETGFFTVRQPVERTAAKCPVCEGKQEVLFGFYYLGDEREPEDGRVLCRSCSGTGVVWS